MARDYATLGNVVYRNSKHLKVAAVLLQFIKHNMYKKNDATDADVHFKPKSPPNLHVHYMQTTHTMHVVRVCM